MHAPRHFHAPRGPLSPAADPRQAEANLAQSAPDSSVTAALRAVTRFGREARAVFPDLNVEVFLVEKSDQVRGTDLPQWGVRASGQALGAARPSTQAATPAQALQQLRSLVAALRTSQHAARDARALARRPPPVCFGCRGALGHNAEACTTCNDYLTAQSGA